MISFHERFPGITVATVSNRYATAEASLYGAHVLSYRPEGGDDLLFMSSASAFEPGKPIRGGIPLCFPWFGPRFDDPSMPQHGFARTSQWKVVSCEDSPEGSTLVLGLSDDHETRRMWPHSFAAALSIGVGTSLTVSFSVTNTGDGAFTFTDALHTYLNIPDIGSARVLGLEGADYFDRVGAGAPAASGDPWPRKRQDGELSFTGETDRVYLTDADRTLSDRKAGLKTIIKSDGFPDCVAWNPGETKGRNIADLGEGEWRRFACVETGAVFGHAITVEPGATAYQAMTIGKGR